jgi:uncharacterized protein YrrD
VNRSLKEASRTPLLNHKGRVLGKVIEVLFASGESRVIGYQVERPRVGGLFAIRDDSLVARDRVTFDGETFVLADKSRDAWGKSAAKRLGIDWDQTVVWLGMPVRTESGSPLGTVRDGLFDTESGELLGIGLSGGMTADVAIGTRDVPARLVRTFDGEAIVVADEVEQVATDGGVAVAAGRGAAVAKQAGGELGKQAIEAAAAATVYGTAAVKAAARSKTGKKALGWLKSIKDEVVDAMGDPEEDKPKS